VQFLLLKFYNDYEQTARIYIILALATFCLDMISFFTVYGLLVSFSNEELDDNKSDAD